MLVIWLIIFEYHYSNGLFPKDIILDKLVMTGYLIQVFQINTCHASLWEGSKPKIFAICGLMMGKKFKF